MAARIGDGYCTVAPDAESVRLYRDKAGNGGFVQGGMKVCWDADEVPCGPDVDRYGGRAIKDYEDAGFDELYINQIGPDQDAFFAAYRDEVFPRVRYDARLPPKRRKRRSLGDRNRDRGEVLPGTKVVAAGRASAADERSSTADSTA